jgi:hypothetical protein
VPKRPRDANQLAKLIVDISTGEAEDSLSEAKRNPQPKPAQIGRAKGGNARAAKLSSARRKQIARAAARKRWGKS